MGLHYASKLDYKWAKTGQIYLTLTQHAAENLVHYVAQSAIKNLGRGLRLSRSAQLLGASGCLLFYFFIPATAGVAD